MSKFNHPVWITEFDIDSPDSDEKAADIADFLKSAFSHPSVEGIMIWDWLRVDFPWENEVRFAPMFEGNLGWEPHVPVPEDCDEFDVLCNFGAMKPNKAGDYKYNQMNVKNNKNKNNKIINN